jgi:HEAT repeat protein
MLYWTLRRLRAGNAEKRRAAARELGQSTDPRAIAALAEALADPADVVVTAAAEGLLGAGAEGLAALLSELRSFGQRDGGQAWHRITRLLAATRETPVVDRLSRALDGQPPGLRREAVRVLASFGDPRAVPALVQAMADADEAVVTEAVEALGRSGLVGVPAMVSALEGGSTAARRCVAKALGQRPGTAMVRALVQALADRDSEVRRAAARSLGDLKEPWSLDALLAALRDPSGSVAQEAATAVGKIGDPRAVEALVAAARGQTGQGANLAVVEALGKLADPRALAFLLQRLDHPDPRLVAAAALALGSFQDPQAADALIAKLEHAHETVRVAAANSLARIGNPMAATALTLALERAARRGLPEEKDLSRALRQLTTAT